jgi:cell division septation protein DedD
VAIFNPEMKEETNAKPKKTRKVEEVVKEREAKGIPDEEQLSGRAATTTDEPVTKPKKDKATGAVVPQDEQQNADQPDIEKTVEAPADEQTAPPINKKKKKAEEPASWAIQLASVRNPNEAKAEWRRLLGRFKDLLEGKKLTVVRAHLGERGIFYRLRIGGFQHKSSAVMLCDSIKAKGGNCLAILIRQSNAE